MMKNLNYILIILILFVSCSETKKKEQQNQTPETSELKAKPQKLNIIENSNNTINGWVNYYREIEPSFSLNDFNLQSTDSLTMIQGNIFGNFDQNFDSIYSKFLVYSPDRKQYVDFDSYHWSLDENNEPSFSPDQEIDLINIKNKTVNRIAFRGPSYWVENVFWENDSTIVLLENNYEKQPIVTELNLKSKTVKTFKYRDTLNLESKYSEFRFKEKGLKYE
jgi:hypothetical protein